MAKKERFFAGPIDKTPYGSCAYVAAFVGFAFVAGAALLWNIAGSVKSFHLPTIKGISLPASSESVVDQVKKATQSAIPAPTDSVKNLQDQAQERLKQEAEKQLQQQIQTTKDQYYTQ